MRNYPRTQINHLTLPALFPGPASPLTNNEDKPSTPGYKLGTRSFKGKVVASLIGARNSQLGPSVRSMVDGMYHEEELGDPVERVDALLLLLEDTSSKAELVSHCLSLYMKRW